MYKAAPGIRYSSFFKTGMSSKNIKLEIKNNKIRIVTS